MHRKCNEVRITHNTATKYMSADKQEKKQSTNQSPSFAGITGGKILYYSDLLKHTELFDSLLPDDLQEFLKYSEERRFAENECIFPTDSVCISLYIIAKGEVAIEKKKGEEYQQLATYKKNDIFGENGLFLNSKRRADARAMSQATILQFPASAISHEEMMRVSPQFCNRILNILISHVAYRIRSINSLIGENNHWVNTLKEQLITDKLTGLYDLKSYRDEFVPRLDTGDPVTAVMLKPRNFKTINDRYGHETGDAVLSKLGALLLAEIGSTGLAFRYAGSEFAFVFHNDEADTKTVDNRMKSIIEAASHLSFEALGVSSDARLSFMSHRVCYPDDYDNLPDLLDYAHNQFMKVFTRE